MSEDTTRADVQLDTRTQAVIAELEEQNTWLRTRAALLAGELAEFKEKAEGFEAKANGKREPSREKV